MIVISIIFLVLFLIIGGVTAIALYSNAVILNQILEALRYGFDLYEEGPTLEKKEDNVLFVNFKKDI